MTTLAAIGKKALLFLLGDKKGRKTVGYTIGIAGFLALLPLFIVMGLFHWLCGDGGAAMREQVRKEAESAYTESVEQYKEWEVLEDAVRR
mgnify:CR=1 FL=1